jgi:hypothetical protein
MAESTKTTHTVNIAPIIRDAAHAARIDETMRALEAAHHAVADAAGRWVDEGCPSLTDRENPGPAIDVRDAVVEWRTAGETYVRAVAGRS